MNKIVADNTKLKRPTKVHSKYCKYCPSRDGASDPESRMIASMPNGVKQTYVFSCAWRNEKLCKGVCEELDYQEEKHGHLLDSGV